MNERILVIDDEPLILASIDRALKKVGYETITAMDMKSFRDALANYRFRLVIMDLHIKGVDINELTQEALKNAPDMKFLTISGSVTAQNSRYFLQKPFKIEVLREKVREILNEPF